MIFRGEAAGFGEQTNSAIQNEIADAESGRRKRIAAGVIEPARCVIVTQHFISDDVLFALLQHSPFISSDVISTFTRGFAQFFQGDFTSATYILVPLLENSLRHVLKAYGYDVTKFDDATQTQEDRTISSLFEQMREELESIFSPAIAADLENVFTKKPGPHLRHSLVHGLLHDSDPYGTDAIYGCWLIFKLCLWPLIPYREKLRTMLAYQPFTIE